jgi:hypothetical protein
MTKSTRRELIDTVRKRLVPALEGLGFSLVALSDQEKRSEVGAAFPFGRLRRSTATGFDLVEIQFNKDGSASFRLNIAQVPTAGIEHAVGRVAAEDVWVHYLDHFCTLYARRFLRRWFHVEEAARQDQIDATVERVVDLLPQVDDYLRHGRRGGNLRCV